MQPLKYKPTTSTHDSGHRLVIHLCGHGGVGMLGIEHTVVNRVRVAPEVRRVIGLTCSGTSQKTRIISGTERRVAIY